MMANDMIYLFDDIFFFTMNYGLDFILLLTG